MSRTMNIWQMDAFGVENLRLAQAPVPSPKPGEVLVKVEAAALNYRDKLLVESGLGMAIEFPFTPGSDMAGTVEAIGEGVTRFNRGDRVISTFAPDWLDGPPVGNARAWPTGQLGGELPGVLAEYVSLPQDWFVRAPNSLGAEAASTLPCAGLTAWFALVETGGLRAGQRVVVQGTGGVALFGLQIAKAHGAEVFVTTSSAAKADRVAALGADHVIDRTKQDWVETVFALTGDHGADHILELVGGAHIARSLEAIAPRGRISLIGLLGGHEIVAPTAPMIIKAPVIQGIAVGHRRALEELVAAVDQAQIKPVIDSTYPMNQLPEALARLEEGPFGKVVVKI